MTGEFLKSVTPAERELWRRLLRESVDARRITARITLHLQLHTRTGKQIPRRSKV